MTKKIWFLAVVLSLSLVITTNWRGRTSTASKDSVKNTDESTIVIGYSNWPGWWPWAIAETEGLFAKHGANVELRWYDDYTASLEDLAVGHIDGNCQTLNDTISFATNALSGEVIILVSDRSAGNDKIIVEKGINEIKDLKDKKVALEAGIVEDFLLTLALEKEGMARQNVDIIDVETGAAVEAFVAGQVDAVGAFAPFWLTAFKREGAKEIVSSKDFPGAISDLLVVTQELIDERPDKVQAIVDTWFDVLDFMATNPEEAARIMINKAGVSRKEFQLLKAGTEILDLSENLEAFSEGKNMKHLAYTAFSIADFLQNNFKSIEKKPNLNKLLNSSFIEATKL